MIALFLAVTSPIFAATLSDIHRDKLPQDAAVQSSLDEIFPIEELVDHWSGSWNSSIPKEKVQATLGIGISSLQHAALANPKNAEIFLTLALLEHYAYNVDMDGAEDALSRALDSAHVLNADDERTTWFAAYHHCQTLQAAQGMQEFLTLEEAKPWQQQPQGFWDDYLACTISASMPSHGLRAYDRMKQLYPSKAAQRENFHEMLVARSVDSDVTKHYTAKQLWVADGTQAGVKFTSFACGLSFTINPNAPIQFADTDKGACGGFTNTGPYGKQKKSDAPSIFFVSRPAKEGETLEDFKKAFMSNESHKDTTPLACPAEHCLAIEKTDDKKEYAQIIVFEREQPQYPGLMLEQPYFPAPDDSPKGMVYYHPDERIALFSGKRYFMVGLDSPVSSEAESKIDYEAFVKALLAE
jgi:hypothetical protein